MTPSSYADMERLKQLKLPTLKYIRLRGDMTEVFKLVHNYYDSDTQHTQPFYCSSGTCPGLPR